MRHDEVAIDSVNGAGGKGHLEFNGGWGGKGVRSLRGAEAGGGVAGGEGGREPGARSVLNPVAHAHRGGEGLLRAAKASAKAGHGGSVAGAVGGELGACRGAWSRPREGCYHVSL